MQLMNNSIILSQVKYFLFSYFLGSVFNIPFVFHLCFLNLPQLTVSVWRVHTAAIALRECNFEINSSKMHVQYLHYHRSVDDWQSTYTKVKISKSEHSVNESSWDKSTAINFSSCPSTFKANDRDHRLLFYPKAHAWWQKLPILSNVMDFFTCCICTIIGFIQHPTVCPQIMNVSIDVETKTFI